MCVPIASWIKAQCATNCSSGHPVEVAIPTQPNDNIPVFLSVLWVCRSHIYFDFESPAMGLRVKLMLSLESRRMLRR